MAKMFLAIILFSIAMSASSQDRLTKMIRCLAAEEERIHKEKVNGPVYKLNQELLGQLTLFRYVDLSSATSLNTICEPKTFTPSLKLLEMILNDKNFFTITTQSFDERYIVENQIKDFYTGAPKLFLGYLEDLQNSMPIAGCLEKHIPEYKAINDEKRYTEEFIGDEQIIMRNKRIIKIFAQIKRIDEIAKLCEEEKKKKEKGDNVETARPSRQ